MITANQVTIAVTVYDRRTYIEQAITSALGQSCPVRVIVVEDCSPDPGLQPFVVSRFGSRVTYYRSTERRGLFDNWNACLDLCQTPWLCLLHDDDFLEPGFVEAMLELSAQLPDQGLYYGRCRVVDPAGKVHFEAPISQGLECRYLEASRLLQANPVAFPGDLFRVEYAQGRGWLPQDLVLYRRLGYVAEADDALRRGGHQPVGGQHPGACGTKPRNNARCAQRKGAGFPHRSGEAELCAASRARDGGGL